MGLTPRDGATERHKGIADGLVALSHEIHAHPELGFQEERASGWLGEQLSNAGFDVIAGACDLPTSIVARSGSGPLNVAFVGEYDCLPGIGHACGHNVIAAISLGAAMTAAKVADDVGLTVTFIGTPAQEVGGGKILMLERGGFDGIHAALMAHPAPSDVVVPVTLAMSHLLVTYSGRESHASMFPELGVNALDALNVAQTAIGFLRQQLAPTTRVHGVVRHGGDAPHVIPHHVTAEYMVRAENLSALGILEERVLKCFEAGALASGATVEVEPFHSPYAEVHLDPELSEIYRRNATGVGRTFFDIPQPILQRAAGATDMGNVSLKLPAIQPAIGLDSFPAVPHMADFAAAAATTAADTAVIQGALSLALTAIDAGSTPEVRERLLAGPAVKQESIPIGA
jgi:amidohydrolase